MGRRGHGFSLIELVLVVSIIAVTLTFILPNITGRTPKYALRSAAREVAATVQQARAQAALDRETFGMRYDLAAGTYVLLLPEALGSLASEETLRVREMDPEVRLEAVITPDNESHEGGEVEVEISPAGTSGSHIVVLKNSLDQFIYVKFHALAGTITFSTEKLEWREYEP